MSQRRQRQLNNKTWTALCKARCGLQCETWERAISPGLRAHLRRQGWVCLNQETERHIKLTEAGFEIWKSEMERRGGHKAYWRQSGFGTMVNANEKEISSHE